VATATAAGIESGGAFVSATMHPAQGYTREQKSGCGVQANARADDPETMDKAMSNFFMDDPLV
jgi:hypothetical protein